jgi:flavin-dependent dehydrogenase
MLAHDLLIVGGGLAGLRTAVGLCEKYDVAIVSKVHPIRSHSIAAQGGINASLANNPDGRDDTWENTPLTRSRGAIIWQTSMPWRSCAGKLLRWSTKWNTGAVPSADFLTAP